MLERSNAPERLFGPTESVQARLAHWCEVLESGERFWAEVNPDSTDEEAKAVFLKAYEKYQQDPWFCGTRLRKALDEGRVTETVCDPDKYLAWLTDEINKIVDQAEARRK